MLNRTHHHHLIRGCRDSGGGRGGGGFVSRCSQKHNLTPDEHLPFLCTSSHFFVLFVFVVCCFCAHHLNRTKKLTTTEKRSSFSRREAKKWRRKLFSLSLLRDTTERERETETRGNKSIFCKVCFFWRSPQTSKKMEKNIRVRREKACAWRWSASCSTASLQHRPKSFGKLRRKFPFLFSSRVE